MDRIELRAGLRELSVLSWIDLIERVSSLRALMIGARLLSISFLVIAWVVPGCLSMAASTWRVTSAATDWERFWMSCCKLVSLFCDSFSRAMCLDSHSEMESATDWDMRLCVMSLMTVGEGSEGVAVAGP